LRRLRLAARMRGGGFQSLEQSATVAYAACFIEAAEGMVGTVTRPGYFAMLTSFFGPVARFESERFLFATRTDPLDMPLSFAEFGQAWRTMQTWVAGSPVRGPLRQQLEDAGARRGTDRLQRSLPAQNEQVQRDQLHHDMALLPTDPLDPRFPIREAWFAADCLSSQLVSSHPTRALECEAEAWREMFTTYLGAESPACRPLQGRVIPVARGVVYCDQHGRMLSAVRLPVETYDACHDVIVSYLDDLMQSAGFRPQQEPRGIFTTLLPPALLMQQWGRPGVVPDLMADVPMPAWSGSRGVGGRAPTAGPVLPARRLLWDVKTIHGGTGWYLRQRQALGDQSGAVGVRARHIWPAYLHHARALDVGYSPAGTTPIEDRLRSYSPTRGLVFGAYAEASLDVHMLLVAAASARAGQVWRRWA